MIYKNSRKGDYQYMAFTDEDVDENGSILFNLNVAIKVPHSISAEDILNLVKKVDEPSWIKVFGLNGSDTLETFSTSNTGILNLSHCKNLKSVSLCEGVYLSKGCFEGCKSLEELDLPESVNSVYQKTFADCTSLKRVMFKGNVYFLSSDDEIAGDDINSYFGGCSNLQEIAFENKQAGKEFWRKVLPKSPKAFVLLDSKMFKDKDFVKECLLLMKSAMIQTGVSFGEAESAVGRIFDEKLDREKSISKKPKIENTQISGKNLQGGKV